MKKNRHARVSRDDVKRNAAKGNGPSWFNLPKGVEDWTPDKAGKYLIDILPYEVKSSKNMDKVEKGKLWYKVHFGIHHGVGSRNESVVCPRSVGSKCPICEERDRLVHKGESDDEVLRKLNAQKFTAFNIISQDDKEKVAIFAWANGKFYNALKKELHEGEDDNLLFFDTSKDGKTLAVRLSDASYDGRKFLETTRIDFRDREELDEDEWLEKVVDLDNMLVVLEYDKLKKMFLEVDEEEAEVDDEDDEPKKSKKSSKKDKDEDEDEEEEEDGEDESDSDEDEDSDSDEADEDDGEEDEDDSDEDEEDEDDSSDDDDEDDEDSSDEDEDDGEDDDEDDDEDEDDGKEDDEEEDDDEEDEEPVKKSSKKTGSEKPSKKSSKKDDEDEDEKDEDEEENEKPAKKSYSEKSGKKGSNVCPVKGGKFGKDADKYPECEDCKLWKTCDGGGE